MKRFFFTTLLVTFCFANSYSQSDTLNNFDLNDKKTGWWITYLNENLELLDDSVGATHCMYNYYRRNIHLYRFGEGYGTKKHPIYYPENDTLSHGDYILLNGQYITKYKNGNTRTRVTASNGIMTSFKKYYPTGQLMFEVVVSQACGAPEQHCINEYKKDGSLKRESYSYLPKEK